MLNKIQKSLLMKYVLTVLGVLVLDFVMLMLLISVTTGVFIRGYVEDNIYVQQETVGETLDQIVYQTLGAYSRLYTNEKITGLFSETTIDKQAYFNTMYDDAHVSVELFEGAVFLSDDIYVSTQSLRYIVTSNQAQQVLSSSAWIEYVGTYEDNQSTIVLFGKKVINPSVAEEIIGTTFFFVRHQLLAELFSNIAEGLGATYLVDDTNIPVASNVADVNFHLPMDEIKTNKDRQFFSLSFINHSYQLITSSPLEALQTSYGFSWRLVTLQPFSEVFASLVALQGIIIALSVLSLIVAAFLAVTLARRLIIPIKTLSDKLQNYDPQTPNYEESSQEVGDELQVLVKTYADMASRITELLLKTKDDAAYQRKLELDSLQMQINPHFLYNTLDAIAWMAKLKKEPEIEHLVLALARFFRISLHKGDKFITVEEELELIKHFVAIELFRFPDKFTIEYNIEPEVRHYQVLKLIVQPIVENAIKHGVLSLDRMGHIIINAFLKDKDVYIEIIDDGIGFNPPDDLLAKPVTNLKEKGGYGLFNVSERIRLEYGVGYGLSVESTKDHGTKVTIKIAGRI
jgi:two-component system sensor histidine kinase YesM